MVASPERAVTLLRVPEHESSGQALPLQPTPLIGREAELAALSGRLRDPAVRLLTLTGPPGTGKTRLALAATERESERFADGVCFVGLEAVREPEGVVAAIAQALHVRETDAQPLAEKLVAQL